MEEVKAMAKKLGLIETFVINQPPSHGSMLLQPSSGAQQTFAYVVVIDFESTCWDSKDQQSKWQNLAEIIEFPAVLLNLQTGCIEDEFHQYVMPVENPTLSKFCTTLTGITQEKVNSGVPLGTCMMLFNRWIHKVTLEKKITFHLPLPDHKTCTFVTWSDWDLAMCLQNETKRKQIRKPDILSQWIDLRLCYRKFYQRKPQGLKGALAELGLSFSGQEHSGIDDAKNTARLAYQMVKDGCKLAITSSHYLSPPQTGLKRCSLGASRGETTPLSRAGHSKRMRPLNNISNGSITKNSCRKIPQNVGDNKLTSPNNISKKISPIGSIKKGTHEKTLDNLSTPKMQNIIVSNCKRTPPLCRCNRRAVCKVSNSPGPNQGRKFFSCPNQKRSLGMVTKTCSFFMWC